MIVKRSYKKCKGNTASCGKSNLQSAADAIVRCCLNIFLRGFFVRSVQAGAVHKLPCSFFLRAFQKRPSFLRRFRDQTYLIPVSVIQGSAAFADSSAGSCGRKRNLPREHIFESVPGNGLLHLPASRPVSVHYKARSIAGWECLRDSFLYNRRSPYRGSPRPFGSFLPQTSAPVFLLPLRVRRMT